MPLKAVCDEQMSGRRTWCAGRMFHVERDLVLEPLQVVYKAQPAFVVTYDDEILRVEFIVSCGGGLVQLSSKTWRKASKMMAWRPWSQVLKTLGTHHVS